MSRWAIVAAGASLALAACGATTASSPPPPPPSGPTTAAAPPAPPPAPSGDGMLTADGRHFAATRVYKGECAPAGSRGGCHTLTLNPDGSYRNWLFDAAILGTYQIEGDAVLLTPSGPAAPERLALSPDRTRLGELTLER